MIVAELDKNLLRKICAASRYVDIKTSDCATYMLQILRLLPTSKIHMKLSTNIKPSPITFGAS